MSDEGYLKSETFSNTLTRQKTMVRFKLPSKPMECRRRREEIRRFLSARSYRCYYDLKVERIWSFQWQKFLDTKRFFSRVSTLVSLILLNVSSIREECIEARHQSITFFRSIKFNLNLYAHMKSYRAFKLGILNIFSLCY